MLEKIDINFDLILKNKSLIQLVEKNERSLNAFLEWCVYYDNKNNNFKNFKNYVLNEFKKELRPEDINDSDLIKDIFLFDMNLFIDFKLYLKDAFAAKISSFMRMDEKLFGGWKRAFISFSKTDVLFELNDRVLLKLMIIIYHKINCKNRFGFVNTNLVYKLKNDNVKRYHDFIKFVYDYDKDLINTEDFIVNEIKEIDNEMIYLLSIDNIKLYTDKLNVDNIKERLSNKKIYAKDFEDLYIKLGKKDKIEIDSFLIKNINLGVRILSNNSPEILTKKVFYILVKHLNYESLKRIYRYSDETIEKIFIYNLSQSCVLIAHVDKRIIIRDYEAIKSSILNGSRIGKQGLKYFLIKNKKRLTPDIIKYALTRYPTFAKSIKCNQNSYKDLLTNKKEFKYNLENLLSKDELNQDEKEYVLKHKKAILKIHKENCSYSQFTKELIKEMLYTKKEKE